MDTEAILSSNSTNIILAIIIAVVLVAAAVVLIILRQHMKRRYNQPARGLKQPEQYSPNASNNQGASKQGRKCEKCGHLAADDDVFCQNCGSTLPASSMNCPKCGKELPADSAFCPRCGNNLKAPVKTAKPLLLQGWLVPVLIAVVVIIIVVVLALAGVFGGAKETVNTPNDDLRDNVSINNQDKVKDNIEDGNDNGNDNGNDEPVSGVPSEYSYVGESGATFMVTPNHVQYRYAYSDSEISGEPLPDLEAWAPDFAELLLTSEEDGYIESFYEIKTYNVDYMDMLRSYCDLLLSSKYNLAIDLPFMQTLQGTGMFALSVYEAGFDYIGNGSVTENSVPGECISGYYTVHFYAQIDVSGTSYLFLHYPSEMSLVNPPVRYGGGAAEPTSGEVMSEQMTFSGARTNKTDFQFRFDGFHDDDEVIFMLEQGSYKAGDVYTIDDWGATHADAIRNLEYSTEFMERDYLSNTKALPDNLKTVTLRILEHTDAYTIVYFHFIALDSTQIYEAEGLGYYKNETEPETANSNNSNASDFCITCVGSGKVKCSKCHGSGTVKKWNAATGENNYVRCTECGGLGKTRCSACGGDGSR